MRLIEVGNDNAVLVHTGTAYREADAPAFVGAMSSAYHRTDGGWKLALLQQTQILDGTARRDLTNAFKMVVLLVITQPT